MEGSDFREEWIGQRSHKFTGSIKYIPRNDQLKVGKPIEGSLNENKQRKHFDEKLGLEYTYKPTMKQFRDLNGQETQEQDQRNGLKKIDFHPKEKRPVPERLHLREKPGKRFEDFSIGIKTFGNQGIRSEREFNLEKEMGPKKRFDSLSQIRGDYPIRSLGDKQYRAPEYSSDFFKEGGLVPGQNIAAKKKNGGGKDIVFVRDPNKLTYKQKEVLEQKKRDQQDIRDLDVWVEKVLKEANPNYKDPDLFFERMQDNQSATTANTKTDNKKDSKKPGKK